MRLSALVGAALITAVMGSARLADAQPRDRAAGEALYQAGRDAMAAGDYATACTRFEESNRVDPAIGTVFNLGACYEKLGKVASAWQRFQEVTYKLPPGDDRLAIAKERAAALEPRLPKLVLTLPADAPKDVKVERNGVVLSTASVGIPLPVDPGSHDIVVRAPGREEKALSIEVAEGDTKEIALEVGPPLPGDATASAGATPDGAADEGAEEKAGPGRAIGFAVGAIGIASLGVGFATGAMALGRRDTVRGHCVDGICDDQGYDAGKEGRTLTKVSTTGFVVGLAGIGAGVTLLLTSRPKGQEQVAIATTIVPGGAGIAVSGGFQ